MDLFEMFRMMQDAYIAGARAQAKLQATEKPMRCKFCGGSNLALMRKGDPVEDDSIAATVCKDRLVVVR